MRWRPRRETGRLAAVASLALVVRVAYLGFATGSIRLHSDAAQYDALARHLAAGDGYVDTYPQLHLHATAFRPPGYPALLSIFYRVFGPSAGLARGLGVGHRSRVGQPSDARDGCPPVGHRRPAAGPVRSVLRDARGSLGSDAVPATGRSPRPGEPRTPDAPGRRSGRK